jgi:predicted patatin/cPLA2 family phospholipase
MANENENHITAKPHVNNKDSNGSNKIDAIREILFGQQIETYEEQFKVLRDRMELIRSQSDKQIHVLQDELLGKLNSLEEKLQAMERNHEQVKHEISKLEAAGKNDRQELGSLIIELGKHFLKE